MTDHTSTQRKSEGASQNVTLVVHALMAMTNQQVAILRNYGVSVANCQRTYDAIQNVLMIAIETAGENNDAGE